MTELYQRVLVPIDASDAAKRAARRGIGLAKAYEADLHFLSVVDTRAFSESLADLDELVRSQARVLEKEAETTLTAVEELAADAGIAAITDIRRGRPPDTILEYGADHEIDLIAMGTHGRSGLDRLLLGSVTERVLRSAESPVLSVSPDDRRPPEAYDNVLIPTDGSDQAEVAAGHGIDIADKFDGRIHAFNVVDVTGLAGAADAGYLLDSVVEGLEEVGQQATDMVAAMAREVGVESVSSIEQGTPHREILEYVESHEIDLIAMGSHGRTGLDRLLLGSVAERIVRSADVPVLTVSHGHV